jgi:Ca-activated chloride channel homolog
MVSLRIPERARRVALGACLLLGFLTAAPAQQQPPAGAVSLSFTVVDKNGRPVTNLRREDVRVLEDGAPQEVLTLERRDAQPLAIILALDMSISQERIIPVAKQAAQHLIDSLSQERDSVGVLSFTGEAVMAQELTDNLEGARHAVEGLKFVPPEGFAGGIGGVLEGNTGVKVKTPPRPSKPLTQGSTAIWDAVWVAAEKLGAAADSRRLVVLITDGYDTSSKRKVSDAADAAVRAGAAVYVVGIGDEYYGGVNKGELRKLAERTGGRASFPAKAPELRESFAELSYELGSQYVVTYSPAAANGAGDKMRKVKIELVNPELRKQKLRLAHPQGYYERRP